MRVEEKIKAAKKRIAELKILIKYWTENEHKKNFCPQPIRTEA